MRLICFFFALVIATTAYSYEFKLALLHGNSEVFDYEINVLKLALKNAPGQHSLEIIAVDHINQSRLLKNLKNEKNHFNVFFSGFTKQRERELLQVDFPITRGLLGYRVFAILEKNLESLGLITQLGQFKQGVSIGSGIGWPDTIIFQNSGFEVIETHYDGLWNMLKAGRITAFNRGINEAFIEVEQQNSSLTDPKIVIDPHLMVVYPLDYFFYVSPLHPELYKTIKEGLDIALKNGEFMQAFYQHPRIKQALQQLKLTNRRVFKLHNPLLSERIINLPQSYWHQPDE